MRALIPCLLSLLLAGLVGCGDNIHPEAARSTREIISGGARLHGGGVRMDVQVGRPLAQRPVRADRTVAKPNAVVTP
jgi:hypothetical protein